VLHARQMAPPSRQTMMGQVGILLSKTRFDVVVGVNVTGG
jgi:hypothetical protein